MQLLSRFLAEKVSVRVSLLRELSFRSGKPFRNPMTKEQLRQLEKDLWDAADSLRANSDLRSSEYSTPVLGLIFLRFADNEYRQYEKQILDEYAKLKGARREKPMPLAKQFWSDTFGMHTDKFGVNWMVNISNA